MTSTISPKFSPGDRVRVRLDYPNIHHRTPWFFKGKTGTVEVFFNTFPNPESRAYGGSGLPMQPLYRVAFNQSDIWDGYKGPAQDKICFDAYESWLEPV